MVSTSEPTRFTSPSVLGPSLLSEVMCVTLDLHALLTRMKMGFCDSGFFSQDAVNDHATVARAFGLQSGLLFRKALKGFLY